MALIRNPVTVVQEGGELPEEYPGPYTVTENGTVPCNGKRMTSDLTVNVAEVRPRRCLL